MTQHDDKKQRLARERALYRYGRALEDSDFDTLARINKMAESDPVLARQITELEEADMELSSELASELAPELALLDDADLVRQLLARHISSATRNDAEPAPITVAEVAGKLLAERKVAPGDEAALLKLQGHDVPVPQRPGLGEVRRLAERLGVRASEPFLHLFREAALLLGVGHSQQAGFAAARRHEKKDPSAPRDRAEDDKGTNDEEPQK